MLFVKIKSYVIKKSERNNRIDLHQVEDRYAINFDTLVALEQGK